MECGVVCFQRFVGGSVDFVILGLGGAGLAIGGYGVWGAVLFIFNVLWEGPLILRLLGLAGWAGAWGVRAAGCGVVLFSTVCGRLR